MPSYVGVKGLDARDLGGNAERAVGGRAGAFFVSKK